jgi:hypothetical protein
MAKTVAVLLLFSFVLALALTSGVPVAGKVVFERDVVEKVKEASKPIRDDMNTIKDEQKVQGDKIDDLLRKLNEQIASTTAAQMRLMKGKRCRSIDAVEREWLQREIDRLQDDYLAIKATPYNVPACGDL